MVVLFTGGISKLRRGAIQIRVFTLERVGMSTTGVGLAICH